MANQGILLEIAEPAKAKARILERVLNVAKLDTSPETVQIAKIQHYKP